MKIRNGFVSNSSSSSFIIALDLSKNDKCKCCGRSDPDFEDAIESNKNYDDNKVKGVGYEDILSDMRDNLSYYGISKLNGEHPQVIKVRDRMEKYRDNKWKLLYFGLSYHAEVLHVSLKNLLNSGTAKIIYDEENKYAKEEELD